MAAKASPWYCRSPDNGAVFSGFSFNWFLCWRRYQLNIADRPTAFPLSDQVYPDRESSTCAPPNNRVRVGAKEVLTLENLPEPDLLVGHHSHVAFSELTDLARYRSLCVGRGLPLDATVRVASRAIQALSSASLSRWTLIHHISASVIQAPIVGKVPLPPLLSTSSATAERTPSGRRMQLSSSALHMAASKRSTVSNTFPARSSPRYLA